ncbi:MAG: hypothetical protein J2P58_02970 [Acidimicrobiaceae bacterium]|nr:hypothetical protein [Acidimicrobiaceae bacterium]
MAAEEDEFDIRGVHGAETYRDLPEGFHVELSDGSVGEIIANPHDGANLLLRITESPDQSRVGAEEWTYFEVVRRVRK